MTNSQSNQRNGENQRMAVNNGEIEMLVEELEKEKKKAKSLWGMAVKEKNKADDLMAYLQLIHDTGAIDATQVLDKYK